MAACHVFRQQAWRFGVSAPDARVQRARQERRLGALAEQAGDRVAAILHYRLALASCARVGVTRRLRRLEAHGPRREAGTLRIRPRMAGVPASRRFDSTPHANGAVMCQRAFRPPPHPEASMNGRIQIVGRLPVELSRRIRAAAKQRKMSLNACLIEALTQALGARRVAEPKQPR